MMALLDRLEISPQAARYLLAAAFLLWLGGEILLGPDGTR